MRQQIEILIPIVYTIQRDVYRESGKFLKSVGNTLKNVIFMYLWIPFYCLFLLQKLQDPFAYIIIMTYLLAFMIVYEIGYLIADIVLVKYEDKHLRRVIYEKQPPLVMVISGVIFRILIFILLAYILCPDLFNGTVIIFVTTPIMFLVHAILKEQYRLATFIGLRILKGLAPYSCYILILPKDNASLVFSGLLGTAIYYSVPYYSKKLGRDIDKEYLSFNNFILRLEIVVIISALLLLIFRINIGTYLLFYRLL